MPLPIRTDRLVLRALRPEDVDAFVAYRADPEVARYQGWETSYARADAEKLVAEQAGAELATPGEWLQIGAVTRADGASAGDCAVRVAGEPPATAEVGVTFARAYQGRGLAAEALGAVVGELFARHAIHRVFAQADERNVAVHRLLERLGFRCEGRSVEADWFKGAWSTLRVYAVLARDWPPGHPM